MSLADLARKAAAVPGAEWAVFAAIASRHVGKDATAAFVLAFTPDVCQALVECARELDRIDRGLSINVGREQLDALTKAMKGTT